MLLEGLLVALVTGALTDGQRRISGKPRVLGGEPALIEQRAAIGRNPPHMATRGAQAGRYGRRSLPPRVFLSHHAKRSHTEVMPGSEAVTQGVRIEVESRYAPEQSQPFQQHWFFYYTVRISNEGFETVQLVSRHWIITDANGHVEEVKGPGVVGQQPVLAPGESFEYTSGCPLRTPTGSMHGTYQMVSEDGEGFDVEIARFELREPYTVH